MLYHCLADALAMPTLVVALAGARVLRGDYRRMAAACQGPSIEIALVISMGNDLLGRGPRADAVTLELRAIEACSR